MVFFKNCISQNTSAACVIAFLLSGSLGCGDSESAGATGVQDAGSDHADAVRDGSEVFEPDAPVETGVLDGQDCVPQPGPDLPDDGFEDTNCDGIDGDVAAAIFVAPSGDDAAAGTIDAPVASFLKAVELAVSQDKAIYVCNATYAEALHIDQSVSVYGGYDCSNGWQRKNERPWAAPPKGNALVIEDVDGPVEIERMGFRSADANELGGSSVAARIVRAFEVRLSRDAFEAGNGANGQPGAQVSHVVGPAPDGEAGESLPATTCKVHDLEGVCLSSGKGGNTTFLGDVCTQGGHGGDGGNAVLKIPQGAGQQGFPDGAPGGTDSREGIPGGPGGPGVVGVASQDGVGSLDQDEYVPSNSGGKGGEGKAGQAGGGGCGGLSLCDASNDCHVSTTFCVGGGGGQGGLGGCGGPGGNGGGGGGAAIGLLVVESAVELASCFVTTGDGGMGGAPSAGAAGQRGGNGGPGGTGTEPYCNGFAGGPGGNGGPGGAGGPGGGGPSLGLLVSGLEPRVLPTTVFDIGLGGDGGKGIAGADGANGVSAETLTLDGS